MFHWSKDVKILGLNQKQYLICQVCIQDPRLDGLEYYDMDHMVLEETISMAIFNRILLVKKGHVCLQGN